MVKAISNVSGIPNKLGSYTVTGKLATSLLSAVYIGRDEQGQEVAVKLGIRSEIEAEYALMMQANSPHIVRPLSVGHYEGPIDVEMPASFYKKPLGYLAMEFLTGITLDKYFRRPDLYCFIPEEVVDQMAKISASLLPLWDRGNIHGDIKPHNIMDMPHGLVLFDFNVGAIYSIGAQDSYRSIVLGSLGYLVPERHLPGASVSLSWDFFGIGALLYLSVFGKSYLSARDPLESREQMILMSKSYEAEHTFEFLSEPWKTFMLRVCHHDPDKRISDPRQFLRKLEELGKILSAG